MGAETSVESKTDWSGNKYVEEKRYENVLERVFDNPSTVKTSEEKKDWFGNNYTEEKVYDRRSVRGALGIAEEVSTREEKKSWTGQPYVEKTTYDNTCLRGKMGLPQQVQTFEPKTSWLGNEYVEETTYDKTNIRGAMGIPSGVATYEEKQSLLGQKYIERSEYDKQSLQGALGIPSNVTTFAEKQTFLGTPYTERKSYDKTTLAGKVGIPDRIDTAPYGTPSPPTIGRISQNASGRKTQGTGGVDSSAKIDAFVCKAFEDLTSSNPGTQEMVKASLVPHRSSYHSHLASTRPPHRSSSDTHLSSSRRSQQTSAHLGPCEVPEQLRGVLADSLRDRLMNNKWRIYSFDGKDDYGARHGVTYAKPKGWMKRRVRADCWDEVKSWPIVYHGTTAPHIDGILKHGLQPPGSHGVTVAHGQAGGTGQTIYVSPSIYLAGFPVYSQLKKMSDNHWLQLVLQCKVKPGSYTVRKNTLGGYKHWPSDLRMDPQYPNNEKLEFLVQDPKHVVVIGLMVRELGSKADATIYGDLVTKVDESHPEGPEYKWTEILAKHHRNMGFLVHSDRSEPRSDRSEPMTCMHM